MASTSSYKNQASVRQKVMTVEDSFAKGMKYTNSPEQLGFARAIVNFDLKDDGMKLVPRGGLHNIADKVAKITTSSQYKDYCVHHANSVFVALCDESDTVLCNYSLIGALDVDGKFNLSNSVLVIEFEDTYLSAPFTALENEVSATAKLLMKPAVHNMHGMEVTNPTSRTGMYVSIEANTYLPIHDTAERCFGYIYAKFNADRTAITWGVKKLKPKEVQPTQAVNYGYNMLKTNPYAFADVETATGAVLLTGVVPYAEDGKTLLLTARPGTPITFALYYKYPASDIPKEQYMVQWEIQDLDSNSDVQVLQSVRSSSRYTPGTPIRLNYTPTYKHFALIVKLYTLSSITDKDKEMVTDKELSELIKNDNHLLPEQVLMLASYYLTSDSSSNMLNATPVTYDLTTATGMCQWQQRLVLWGVASAKSTLFVSEVNSPDYVPYPNNSEIFTSDIIGAVPYMSDLLVFTTTSLYRLTMNTDGLSYSSKCIQERLTMTQQDANTIMTVQNMIYFKSSNYFYMIVPNAQSLTGELQMAPVSRSIEFMLNNFEDSITKLLDDVYNVSYLTYGAEIVTHLKDYNVYLDDSHVRNVYKIQIDFLDVNDAIIETKYVDLSLNYDTVLRAWTCYTWESTPYRMVVYKPTVTGETIFSYLYGQGYDIHAGFVQLVEAIPKDEIPLGNDKVRTLGNYQYVDTGFRQHSPDYKKRFREVQFSVNTQNNQQLNFYTAFNVDDDERKAIYKHEVSHCTDPNDPNYGMIFVERVLTDPVLTPNVTKFDSSWTLDSSKFPELTVSKIRYRVTGKGYGGKVRLLSVNETSYELLNINWVYRLMYAR